MKAVAGALGMWTVVVVALLLLDPGFMPGPLCMRLVGRSAACEAQATAWNDALWLYRTVPLIAVVATGYVVIVSIAVIGAWRRRTRR